MYVYARIQLEQASRVQHYAASRCTARETGLCCSRWCAHRPPGVRECVSVCVYVCVYIYIMLSICVCVCLRVCLFACVCMKDGKLLKSIGLFCKRVLSKRRYSAKETYNFKELTNRSHPIAVYSLSHTHTSFSQ